MSSEGIFPKEFFFLACCGGGGIDPRPLPPHQPIPCSPATPIPGTSGEVVGCRPLEDSSRKMPWFVIPPPFLAGSVKLILMCRRVLPVRGPGHPHVLPSMLSCTDGHPNGGGTAVIRTAGTPYRYREFYKEMDLLWARIAARAWGPAEGVGQRPHDFQVLRSATRKIRLYEHANAHNARYDVFVCISVCAFTSM